MNYKNIITETLKKIDNTHENLNKFSKKDFEKNRTFLWKIIGKIFPKYRNFPFHNLTKFKDLNNEEAYFIKEMKKINGMSTLSNALIINSLCKNLNGKNYVNIGCWEGFTLLSGMINTGCNVYGVDNFSQFDGPSKKFYKNFKKFRKKNHYFFEVDYKFFLKDIWSKENKSIDLYFYDGNHSYQDQFDSLEIAQKYFIKNSIIIVDDTNIPDVKQATNDFITKYGDEYEILFDIGTSSNGHFTFWNGLTIFIKK